jgi:DNA modification methylase
VGVGSTGESALINKRKFIGFELNEKYFKAASTRLEDCIEKLKINSN